MKVWFSYTYARSGSTVFTKSLAQRLERGGFDVVVQEFPHWLQYFPAALRTIEPPPGTKAAFTNSWNGFAFHRPGLASICIQHLFVLDERLQRYKTLPQSWFHDLLVRRFIKRSYGTAARVVGVVTVSKYTGDAIRKVFPFN